MKKILKFIGIFVAVSVVLLVVGIGIFLKTLDLNRYRAQIIEAAEGSLSRRVDFKDIDIRLSLSKGVSLSLLDFVIGEDPDFGAGNFLSARGLELGVSLYDFLFKGEIRVLDVSLQSLELSVIKHKDGRLNIQTLAQKSAAGGQPSGTGAAPIPAAAALPAVIINQVSCKDASVAYADHSYPGGLSIRLEKINFEATDISLGDEFHFRLQAAYLHDAPNIHIEGNARLHLPEQSFELTNTDCTIALSTFSLEKLRESIPSLGSVSLPQKVQGTARAEIVQFKGSGAGLFYLNALLQLQQGMIQLAQLPQPIDDLDIQVAFNEERINIRKAGFRIGEGTVEVTGDVDGYLKNPSLTASVRVNGLQIADVLDQSGAEVKLRGLLSSQSELKAQGVSPGKLLDSLSATMTVSLTDGKVSDLNILKAVLDKVTIVPNLAGLLESGLPEEWKEKIRKKDTVLTAVSAQAHTSGRSAVIDTLRLEADSFIFEGSGQLRFDRSYELDGKFIIPEEFSGSMVKAVNEMDFLRDEQKRIGFPLLISGRGQSVSFTPDVRAIGVSVIEQKGRQELKEILDKVLDRGESDSPEQAPQAPAPSSAEPSADTSGHKQEQSLEDVLIGTVLDTILQ